MRCLHHPQERARGLSVAMMRWCMAFVQAAPTATAYMGEYDPTRPPNSGRSALVTGAARGIGRAICERLTAEGATVTGVDLVIAPDPTAYCDVVSVDVTDIDGMTTAVARAAVRTGCLDICVANAGVGLHEPFLTGLSARWTSVVAVNLIGVMVAFQAAASRMVADRAPGRLIATSSTAGLRGEAGSSAYCASKGGVNALVQSLAAELAQHRITVNAVAPGEVETALQQAGMEALALETGRHVDQVRDGVVSMIPAGRLASPSEIAAAYAFLASDAADYVTGTVLRVDGGQLLL